MSFFKTTEDKYFIYLMLYCLSICAAAEFFSVADAGAFFFISAYSLILASAFNDTCDDRKQSDLVDFFNDLGFELVMFFCAVIIVLITVEIYHSP